jgi:hypothetical protein
VGLQLRAVEHYYQVLFLQKNYFTFFCKNEVFSKKKKKKKKKTGQTQRYWFFVLFWFPPFCRVFCKLDRLINVKVFASCLNWSNLQVKK